ncbi:MAG: heat-inducible transcriptional repressor HrcA [Eubacteriales bacterium]
MKMDERKQKILKAIVQDYIATAEPVGSRTISRKFDLGVSPATIRNEMSDLEEMGFIEQPHTSSGRIPSDIGYRYYVDYLMAPIALQKVDKNRIKDQISSKISEVEEALEYTGKLISQITNLTSLVLCPRTKESVLQKLYFLPYQQGKAIMVTIKENGSVENNIVDIGEDTTTEELQVLANIFNENMGGTRVRDLKSGLLREIYNELSRKRKVIDFVLSSLESTFSDNREESPEIYLGGTLNMLNQPEFHDLDKVKTLFSIFEENSKLKELIHHDKEGRIVTIGSENSNKVFKDCSVISATYHVNGKEIGSIGVLGPTRMDYSKAIAIVDYMTFSLTELLTNRQKK